MPVLVMFVVLVAMCGGSWFLFADHVMALFAVNSHFSPRLPDGGFEFGSDGGDY